MDRRKLSDRKRLALTIQYDGTAFHGWQIQDNERTVQRELENALKILTREQIRVTASGRTDTGVHALGQVIHFDTESKLSLQRFCIGLNGIMPKDVSIINAYIVPDDFHSRFSAVERQYIYKIYNHPLRTPFIGNRQMWVREFLDIEKFQEYFAYLIGEHDFASFCKKKSCEQGTVRKINSINVTRDEFEVTVAISGNAFLHNMIRIIIGTTIKMYINNNDPKKMLDIIQMRDRETSGETASAFGLYLKKISYNPPLESMPAAFPDALLID